MITLPTFKEDTHEYILGDASVPSVTTIIKAAGCIDEGHFSEEARQRGTAVHLATRYHDEGTLNELTVDKKVFPYLFAYREFRKDTGFMPLEIERVVYSQSYGYAGTIDRIGVLNDKPVLIDLKTGPYSSWHDMQVTAYRMAAYECGLAVDKCYILELRENGRYRLKDCNRVGAFAEFLKAVTKARVA